MLLYKKLLLMTFGTTLVFVGVNQGTLKQIGRTLLLETRREVGIRSILCFG